MREREGVGGGGEFLVVKTYLYVKWEACLGGRGDKPAHATV